MKRNLLVISQGFPSLKDGSGIATLSSLKCYIEHFSHVHYIDCLDCTLWPETQRSFPEVKFSQLGLRRRSHAIRFLKSLLSRCPATFQQYNNSYAFSKLLRIVEEERTVCSDNLYVCFEHLGPSYYLHALDLHIPSDHLLFRSHDVLFKSFDAFATEGHAWSRWAWKFETDRIKRFEAKTIQTVGHFVSICSEDAQDYQKYLGIRPQGILGIEIQADRYAGVQSGDIFTLLHLGGSDARKIHGLTRFLNTSWPIVRQAFPQAKILLGGKGSELFTDFQRGIEGVGFVENEIAYLNKGFIFLNPQICGSGIKLKSLNAMAAGKVLVSTLNGIRGVGGVNGQHYLAGNSPIEMAEHILFVLRNPKSASEIANSARKFSTQAFSRLKLHDQGDALFAGLHQN